MKQVRPENIKPPDSQRDRAPLPWETQILELISEHDAIPMDLLAALLGVDHWVAVRLMNEFVGHRWVKVRQLFVNDEPWVSLRKAGARHCSAGIEVPAFEIARLPHWRAVCEVRLALETEYPDGEWIPERALPEPKAERHITPEAIFRVRNSEGAIERWAVEIDQTPNKQSYGTTIARQCADYDRVLYYCTPQVAGKIEGSSAFDNSKVAVVDSLKMAVEVENFQWTMSPASLADAMPARNRIEPWEAKVVRLVAEQQAIPVDQLARFLRCDVSSAQRIGNHLDRKGLIRQGIGPVGEKPWLWATIAGGRLAEAEFRYTVPWLLAHSKIRQANEARLYMRELNPDGQWWSRRMLRRGKLAMTPAGVVRSGDWECAIEIEADPRPRANLLKKYERRYAAHTKEKRRVVVLCSSLNVEPLEELKRQYEWTSLFVRECPAFNARPQKKSRRPETAPRPHRPQSYQQRDLPLVEVPVEEVPAVILQEIQKLEGSPSPPEVKLAAKRKGKGFPRWRVTTKRNVWRVTRTQHGWHVRPADEREQAEKLLPAEPPRQKQISPLVEISVEDVPEEILIEIQAEEGAPAAVTLAAKRWGTGAPRWRVTTERNIWHIHQSLVGWHLRPADERERAEEVVPAKPSRQKRTRPLVEVPVEDVPAEMLREIQKLEGSPSPPKVKLAGRHKGNGFLRWLVTTERDVWRVTRTQHGWHVRPADERERAEQLVSPTPPRPTRTWPLVEVSVEDVPEDVLRQIQVEEGAPPVVKRAGRRKGPGSPRWLVTTERNVWRVTGTSRRWQHVQPADERERAEKLLPPGSRRADQPRRGGERWPRDPAGVMKDIDVSELPAKAVEAIQEAAGASTAPQILAVSKRRGRGALRWRVETDMDVWRVSFRPQGWSASLSE